MGFDPLIVTKSEEVGSQEFYFARRSEYGRIVGLF